MGLTRLRAEQISDIDYKQAVRVLSIDEVTLAGGAPNQVDGVNLSVNDRILVVGQDSAKQDNGLYYVSVLGTGSNGTWARTNDGNQTGEIQAGMIVMVTEGLVYADTQWLLTTNDPIVIGVTELTFTLNSLNVYFTSISAGGNVLTASGNNSVVNFAEGTGVTISSNTTTNTITFSATATGSGNSISNGTSNVTVVSSGGNVTVGVGGTANVAVFATTGTYVTGEISATANITGGNVLTSGIVSSTSNVVGGNLLTGGLISATGNVTAGNVSTAGTIAVGTVTSNLIPSANVTYSLGNTNNRWKDLWIANSSIYIGEVTIAATGTALTINGANVLTGNAGADFSTSGNVTGGNINTTGLVTATGNVYGGNVKSQGLMSAVGNIQGGNLKTAGIISATSNITGSDLFTSGIVSATGNIISVANISGGNILTGGLISASSNLTAGNVLSGGSVSAVGNLTGGNVNTAGAITATGNATAGNIITAGTITAGGNITGGNVRANLVYISTAGASGNTGDIGWNTAEATFNMYLQNGVVLQAGQENNFWVIANGNITNGQVCAFAGASNNAIIASAANSLAPGFSAEYVIGVATQDIVDGELGYVTTYGKVRDLNTNAFNVGDILYLDPTTPGGFTSTIPVAPNPKVQVAAVLQKGIANGAIVVRPTIFPRLEALQDVDSSNVADNDYLRFTTSGNLWQHTQLDISDDTTPTLGGNLDGYGFNISNVANISGGNITLSGAGYSNAAITQTNQLATKGYVDTATSTGLHIHEPVITETSGNLIATYANGGTTQTVDSITSNKTLTFTTSPALAVDDVIVFDNSFNGITGNTAYFVFSTNGGNQITLTNTYQGPEITTLTNGTSLAQPSRANSGVGATLTNAGANVALNLGNVALSVNDRVLVYQQTNAYENGVYVVSNVGNATTRWVLTRSGDTDSYAPQDTQSLGGGDYFFITNGDAAGESYVCSNDTVIIFGVTPITFTLFSASPAYTGTSPVVVTGQVISLANLTGSGNTVVLQNAPTLITPEIGAATATSVSATGNLTGANVNTAGLITATGNVYGANILTAGTVSASSHIGSTISVSGNVDTGNINGAGSISAVANITGGNITTAGIVSATGNIIGNFFLGNGSQLTGITSSLSGNLAGNIEGNGFGIGGSLIYLTSTGNVTGGNIVTLGNVVANGNITTTAASNGNLNIDPDGTGYAVFSSTTPVIIANNNSVASAPLRLTGAPLGTNANHGILSVGANLGFNDTNILASWTHDVNSYAQMILQNQNAGGSASADFVVNNDRPGGTATYGDFGINSSGFSGAGPFNDPDGTYLYGAGGSLTIGTIGAQNFKIATQDTLRLTIDTTGLVSAVGNLVGGNISTAGLISATGNVTGGNITTVGAVTATGNVTGGNIVTAGLVSATSTITSAANVVGGNITTVGVVTATGNITGGNIVTAGSISATGNVTGDNINGLVSLNTRERTLNFIIDGGGSVITTGSKGYAVIDANCTIQSWTILLDQTGNANVDVKRSTYAGFPTTTSIAGTIPPTVTSNTKAQNTTLTGWGNTTIIAGDILEFVVQETPAVATRVTVALNLISSS